MNTFSTAQIEGAVARLPRQSNASVLQVLTNARRLAIESLVQACQGELRTRGTQILTAAEAEQTFKISARVAGKPLSDVIEIAFREVPATSEELLILRWIWQHPGGSYAELGTVYRHGDLSLVIGHLIYYRFGYFRALLSGPTQSDLLLERNHKSKGVRYTLRPEAVTAFNTLGVLNQAA